MSGGAGGYHTVWEVTVGDSQPDTMVLNLRQRRLRSCTHTLTHKHIEQTNRVISL